MLLTESDLRNIILEAIKTKLSFSDYIKDKNQGDKFRAWVNDNHAKYAIESELSRKGRYNNSYIKNAWERYGQAYISKPATTKPNTTKLVFSDYIKDKNQGDEFRAWVNDNHTEYAKLKKLDRSGSYNNTYVKNAWAEYSKDFVAHLKKTSINKDIISIIGQQKASPRNGISEPYLKIRLGGHKEANLSFGMGLNTGDVFVRKGGSKEKYQKLSESKVLNEKIMINKNSISLKYFIDNIFNKKAKDIKNAAGNNSEGIQKIEKEIADKAKYAKRAGQAKDQELSPEAEAIIKAYPKAEHIAKDIVRVANNLGLPSPAILANLINFETNSSFDPSIQNEIGATGLIQFIKPTAKKLGTTTSALKSLSGPEQMKYVEKYFKMVMKDAGTSKLSKPADIYMAVFFPRAIGRGSNYSIYDYYVKLKGKEWADTRYLKPNAGIKTAGEYVAFANRRAKMPVSV